MCGEFEFDIDKIPRTQEKLYIDAKIRENHLLIGLNHWLTIILQKVYIEKALFLDQNMLFSRRYTACLESEEFYKCQI